MCEPETFWTLLKDPAHWAFELFLMALFDGLIGAIAWPFFRRFWISHHANRQHDCQNQEREAA